MNVAAIILVLELIQKTVKLAPAIIELIHKAEAGEEVTPEEIAETEKQINKAVSEWDALDDES